MKDNLPKTQSEMDAGIFEFIDILNTSHPGTVNDMMRTEYEASDLDKRTLTVTYDTLSWMSNPVGRMHGGIIGAAMDSVMGTLIYALCGRKFPPTVSLQINYVRPIPLGKRIVVRARADSVGRTTAAMSAVLWMEDCPEELMVTATGIYSTAGKPLSELVLKAVGEQPD